MKALDARQFEEHLQRALIALGHQGLLRQLVAPLAHTIGELWRAGIISAAHEHFLTAGLKVFLGHVAGQFAGFTHRTCDRDRYSCGTTSPSWAQS